ncbi:hypothetical protein FH972_022592 [Carpinus fangiana]|uniref:RNA-binding protein VTS1 n=1 Tax=Carpinus fangiana TaxID=176857 RepID=A0A5N6KSP2_9ROSI|nr:hypothetical protein FH972_022592 [Carpinus fangiana]
MHANQANRNSVPETISSASTLRPPTSRTTMPPNHHLRASADVSSLANAGGLGRDIRPASEVYYNQHQRGQSHADPESSMDRAAQQWIADIDQYENTLEEMAAATLDQDFKDELSAIEQWFRVLSEAERTAALYALLQQATQVQTRFFVGVLQEMAKNHPMSGILSPSSFGEKDPMANRLSSAMSRLSVGGDRNSTSLGRPPPSPNTKRNSGLDQHEINSMFPDAAAAIAKQKAEFESRTGTIPTSNRNSTVDRSSLVAPTISAPQDDSKIAQPSPWGRPSDRPKSSAGQQPMGQFAQAPGTGGLRSPRPMPLAGDNNNNIQNTSVNATGLNAGGMGMDVLSPYHGSGNWASMVNTPMVPNFQQDPNQANMVANATAMKLAAMSTVNNRIQLDDVRKYRRARSSEGHPQGPLSPGVPGIVAPNGHNLTPQQMAALQAQQMNAFQQSRSRPNSPGLTLQGTGPSNMNYAGAQQNGFLSAFDGNPAILTNGMPAMHMGEGYLSDASEINRGRSPRGRRGNSRPPEDPTDIELLTDVPAWLRSLRLHKYTDVLKDYKWQELVDMDDATLEKRGVNALGARRKLLKVFSDVKEKQAQGKY